MATTNKAFRVKTGLIVEGAELKTAAGTTTYPQILLTPSSAPGVYLDTATSGAFEYDGTSFYLTASSGGRKTIAFTDTAPASHTHGNILNGGTVTTTVTATSPVKVLITNASDAVGLLTTTSASATTFLRGDGTWVTPTDTNYYPSTIVFNAGTTAGPTLDLTMSGAGAPDLTAVAIPSASASASGIVTTGAQEFAGVKTLTSPSITTSLTSGSATFDLLATPTTINIGTAATTLTVGNTATGAQTVNMFTAATAGGTYNIATAATSSGTKAINIGTNGTTGSTTTITIGTTAGTTPTIALNGAVTLGTTGLVGPATMAAFNTVSTNLSIGGAATTFTLGSTSAGTTTVQAGTTLNLNAPAVNSNASTLALFATPTTINLGAAATAVNIGASSGTVTIAGNLTVNGTTTTVNSNTLTVDDKNLELGFVSSGTISTTGTIGTVSGSGPFTATITGMSSTTGLVPGQVITATAGTGNFGSGVVSVATIASSTSITISSTLTFTAGTVTNISSAGASDASADGGGITLKGSTDKTFRWTDTGDNWTSSENLSLDTGKIFKINNAEIISGTAAALVIGAGASTTIAIGANGGTATILNPTVTLTNATVLNISGATQSIVGGTVAGAASVFNTNTGTVNLGGAALTLNLGGATNPGTTNLSVGASTTGTHTTNIATGNSTGASKIVNIGTGNVASSGTVAVNIGVGTGGTSSVTTTIGNTVKLPQVGTSGFVKLGTGGELSADTNTYVQAASPALTGTPTINSIAGLVTASGSTTGTTALTLSTVYASGTYNGGEFIVKATNSTNIEITKVLVITNGTDVYMTTYGDVFVTSDLVSIDFTYTGANVNMVVTPVAGTSGTTTVKVSGTLVAV